MKLELNYNLTDRSSNLVIETQIRIFIISTHLMQLSGSFSQSVLHLNLSHDNLECGRGKKLFITVIAMDFNGLKLLTSPLVASWRVHYPNYGRVKRGGQREMRISQPFYLHSVLMMTFWFNAAKNLEFERENKISF
jgi:hypothetical protein